MTIKEFMRRILFHPRGCWIWDRGVGSHGYGCIGRELAHREAYRAFIGPIPDGMHVLHRCDRRRCVNPDHLFLGTNADNMADMDSKGRRRVGEMERHRLAKLTRDAIAEIRGLYDTGNYTHRMLAAAFGVSHNNIGSILRRKTWRKV